MITDTFTARDVCTTQCVSSLKRSGGALFRRKWGNRIGHLLLERGATGTIIVVCVLAAPEGIELLRNEGLELAVYTAALDERLNEQAFIVPGLGDAGDRMYGTK